MTGRARHSWVTALTVASLLLGGGALNAFAEGHGGGNGRGHGGGPEKVEHQQQVHQQAPAAVQSTSHGNGNANGHENNKHDEQVQVQQQAQVQDKDEDMDADDLVAAPALETEETRPGLGCGDVNHVHTGPPGNPDKTCKDKHGDHDDQGEVETEDED